MHEQISSTTNVQSAENLTAPTNEEGVPASLRNALSKSLEDYLTTAQNGTLYPAQKDALSSILDVCRNGDSGYVNLPTGVGKTVIFSELIKATQLRSLVVVPTSHLVIQTAQMLKDRGVESVREVSPYQREDRDALVSITTYAGLVKRLKHASGKLLIDPEKYELVILDEGHHAGAAGTSESLKSFPNAFKLGFTASPDYSEARRLSHILPIEIAHKSIPEAVQLNLICPFNNLLLDTDADMSGVKVRHNRDYDSSLLGKALNTPARNRLIGQFYAANLADKKALFACSNVAHLIEMADVLQRLGIKAAAIHSRLLPKIRQDLLRVYREGGLQVLCYAQVLGEGFDDPTVSVAINVSPTLSIVKQLQRSGRALRLDPVNPEKHALIIDCVDMGYRRVPVLFCDKEVAGVTQVLGAKGLSAQGAEVLQRVHGVSAESASVVSDEARLHALSALTPRFSNANKVLLSRSFRPSTTEELVDKLRLGDALNGEWQTDMNCKGFQDDTFMPPRGASADMAMLLCSRCVVQNECLDDGLRSSNRDGIHGGLSARSKRLVMQNLRNGEDPEVVLKLIDEKRRYAFDRATKHYKGEGIGYSKNQSD